MNRLLYIPFFLVLCLPLVPSVQSYTREEATVILAEVSAYTSDPAETDDDPTITASGDMVGEGVIACPSRYRFGTAVEIEGRTYHCLDRMNARYRHKEVFDVWMPEKAAAKEWGRKELAIRIIN